MIVIGTAGWSIPREVAPLFPTEGTGLQRYAARMGGVEVNSSFHRPHRRSTWERWAASVPDDFRFAAKLPKEISHVRKLCDCRDAVGAFLDQVSGLGAKLAILLLQLPPKLDFDEGVAERFLADLAARTPARIVCEPRHPSWFEPRADALLARLGVPRVAADPAPVAAAALPGGARDLAYFRLHGSPDIYRSRYGPGRLEGYAWILAGERANGIPSWCILDNTAAFAALGDALSMLSLPGEDAAARPQRS